MNADKRSWNSTLRPVAKRKMGLPKKPKPRKKPSLEEVKKKFDIKVAALLGEPKRKPIAKRSKNNPGWWHWFIECHWPTVNHECEVCGMPIEEPTPINASHLLPRKMYRHYIREARNVRIKCAEHHRQWHEIPKEELLSGKHGYKREWMFMFYIEQALKDEANGLIQKP